MAAYDAADAAQRGPLALDARMFSTFTPFIIAAAEPETGFTGAFYYRRRRCASLLDARRRAYNATLITTGRDIIILSRLMLVRLMG